MSPKGEHGWSRGCGLTMTVCSLCSAEILSSEKSVSMVICTKLCDMFPMFTLPINLSVCNDSSP